MTDRPLTPRERDVLDFLLQGSDPIASALRNQVRVARVLQEAECCPSIHLYAEPREAERAPTDRVLVIEAQYSDRPEQTVRLVTSANGWLSHLELVHVGGIPAPKEFPRPSELGPPSRESY